MNVSVYRDRTKVVEIDVERRDDARAESLDLVLAGSPPGSRRKPKI